MRYALKTKYFNICPSLIAGNQGKRPNPTKTTTKIWPSEGGRKRVTEDRERGVGIKIIPECPARNGTVWEARLFLLRYG